MAMFLASNLMLGLVLLALLGALAWWHPTTVVDLLTQRSPGWRTLSWVTLLLTLGLILWFSLADDWRKIFGELLDIGEKFASQRAVLQPVDHTIRMITFGLLILTLIPTACLFARHIGGYGLQLGLIILGVTAFFPFYLIRQRLDTGVAGIVTLPNVFSLAMLGIIVYLLLDYAANIALILTSYLGLLGLFALPVTLILDLMGQREARHTPNKQVQEFYQQLSRGIEKHRSQPPERPNEHHPPPTS